MVAAAAASQSEAGALRAALALSHLQPPLSLLRVLSGPFIVPISCLLPPPPPPPQLHPPLLLLL